MNWWQLNEKPLIQALVAFFIMFGGVIILTIIYDFSEIDLGGLLFLMTTLTCVFIAKNIFDLNQADQSSKTMVETLAEELLSSSRELFTEVYYNSPVPYLLIDLEGVVVSANVAAVRLFSIPRERIEGTNVFLALECGSADHLEMIKQKYQRSLTIDSEEVRVKRGDDEMAWALLSLFRFSTLRERHLGLLTLVDVTKQKQIENAKSEFVSLASHQLRTPIAGMKWSAELLVMDTTDPLSPRQKKYIERLLASIDRLSILVDDFLRVSRFELGTFVSDTTIFSLPELFADILKEQHLKVQTKHITVETFFDSTINEIVLDPELLRMIITNLYTNAAKYTPEQGTIHIGYSVKGDEIIIAIADNGIGIPVAEQPNVFKKLFRAQNATRQVPDGTGLGLYIVKEAVSVLHGHISFTSAEGVGTTFEVRIPLVLPAGSTMLPQAAE